jgi:ubiquinone/menaquinone biosynthesis C-methylase UbiE
VTESYRKDMSHVTWEQVFARQTLRAELAEGWMDALDVCPGSCVLDVGAGPGYVSLRLAERVGASGLVYAIDRSADALAYLAHLQDERGVVQIKRVVADATSLKLDGRQADAALVAMVLHHTDDPAGILTNLAGLLPTGAPMVLAEFHPDGPGEQGPPCSERISPQQLWSWCEASGFLVVAYRRQTQEHYMLTLERL